MLERSLESIVDEIVRKKCLPVGCNNATRESVNGPYRCNILTGEVVIKAFSNQGCNQTVVIKRIKNQTWQIPGQITPDGQFKIDPNIYIANLVWKK